VEIDMPLIKHIRNSFLVCAALAQVAGASTIIQSGGNSGAAVPLGYYPPYAPYNMTPIVFAVGWTQTTDFTGVDVFANLFTPGGGGTVNYELVDALGPGTSFATNGIVRGTAATPANPADVDLFHLDSLAAGTYYLVLDSSTAAWMYNYPGVGSFSEAQGVASLGSSWAPGTSINNLYAPASSFSGVNIPVQFSVVATAAQAPEPATFAGTGLALVGFAMMLRKLRG
jgi:hypothetical protein